MSFLPSDVKGSCCHMPSLWGQEGLLQLWVPLTFPRAMLGKPFQTSCQVALVCSILPRCHWVTLVGLKHGAEGRQGHAAHGGSPRGPARVACCMRHPSWDCCVTLRSYRTSSSLSFLICKVEIVIVPSSQSCWEN